MNTPAPRFGPPFPPQHVERCTREVRAVLAEKTTVPDHVAMLATESILKAGLLQFPRSAFLHVVLGGFQQDVLGQVQEAAVLIERSKQLDPTIRERYMVFMREREHKQRVQSRGAEESTMDIVGYVEYQTSFNSAKSAHLAVLHANRVFWRSLTVQPVVYRTLFLNFEDRNKAEARADELYRDVLKRFPKNVALIRMYARFVSQVQADERKARLLFTDAERMEKNAMDATAPENMAADPSMVVDPKRAVAVIDLYGLVLIANAKFRELFGCDTTRAGKEAGPRRSTQNPRQPTPSLLHPSPPNTPNASLAAWTTSRASPSRSCFPSPTPRTAGSCTRPCSRRGPGRSPRRRRCTGCTRRGTSCAPAP